MHPYFQSITIYNTQDMETTLLPMGGWIDKENMVCVCIYIHIHIWNIIQPLKANSALVTVQVKLETIKLSKTSQRKTNTVWSHLFVKSRIKKNKLMNTGKPQRWHLSVSILLESISGDPRMCVKSDTWLSGQYSKMSLFHRDWVFSRQLPLCWAWGWLSPCKAFKDYFSVCYGLVGFKARCFGGSFLKCKS